MHKAVTEEMAREIGVLEHIMHPFILSSQALFELQSSIAILSNFIPREMRTLVLQHSLTEKEASFYIAEVLSAVHHLHRSEEHYKIYVTKSYLWKRAWIRI